MADPITAIGLAASVIQIASTGLKLSRDIYDYVQGVRTADKRLKDVARDVELTSSIIYELGAVFKHQETVELISESALRTADGTVQDCERVFKQMAALVEKSLGRGKKLLFPFREAKIELLRANLERLKSDFQLLMQVLTHAQVVASKNRDSSEVLLQREYIKELVKAKENATQKYEEERVKYQALLEKLDEAAVYEADGGLGSSNSSKVLVAKLLIPSEQQDEAVVRDRDLTSQGTSSLTVSRLGSVDPEQPTRRGVSRSELDYCIRCLQTLLELIESAQELLEEPTSISTEQAVFWSYSGIRAVLDRYLLRKIDEAPDTGAVSSDPQLTLQMQAEHIAPRRSSQEPSADLVMSDEIIRQRKKHGEELKSLRKEMITAMRERDEEYQNERKDMEQRLRRSVERSNQDRENMKAQLQESERLPIGDKYRRWMEQMEMETKREAERELVQERMRREEIERQLKNAWEWMEQVKMEAKREAEMELEEERKRQEEIGRQLKSDSEWKKEMKILRSDDEVAKLLAEWTTISLESIEAA